MIFCNRHQKSYLLSLIILMTLISSCAPATESSTQPVITFAVPSQTVSPTAMPSATVFPTLTLTPIPTITFTPTPTATPHPLSITTSNTGRLELLAKLGAGKADDVAWSDNGKLLAVAANGIDIYDTETLTLIQKIKKGAYQVLFSPNDRFLALVANSIELWDTTKWKHTKSISYQFGLIREIAYSADGTYIAATGMGDGDEHVVQVWNAATGQEIYFHRDAYRLAGISFSPNGQILAVASPKGIMLVDILSGNTKQFQRETFNVAFSSNTTFVANASDTVAVFNTDGEIITKTNISSSHNGFVLSPDNTKLATLAWTTRWELQIWDLPTETEIISFPIQTYFNMVAFSPDSQKIAVVDYAGPIRIWDVKSGKKTGQVEYTSGAFDVTFRPFNSNNEQSHYLLAAGYDGGQTLIWDLHDESIIQSLDGVSGSRVYKTAFTDNGELLASGFQGDHPFWMWDINTGQKLGELECGQSVKNSDGLEVKLPDAACKEPLYIENMPLPPEYEHAGPGDFHFSPDHRFIVAWSYDLAVIFVWDAATHEFLHAMKGHHVFYFDGDVGGIEQLIIHPYYNIIATAGYDSTVRLWDIERGILLQTLSDPMGTVNSVTFSPDGRFLAAGVYDGKIYVWGIEPP